MSDPGTAPRTRGWTRRGAGGSPECAGFPAHAGIDLRVPWSPYSAVGSPRPGGEPTRDGPQLASSCQLACFPRTCGERVRTRCEPVRARSRAGCRNSRSGSMGSILSNRTDSGCVTRSDPISASRTASRFGFCQPFSDLLGPLLTFDYLNKYGIFWDFRLGGIGSGGRRSVKPSCRRAKARFVSSLTLKEGDVRSMSGRYTDAAAAKGATPS